MKENNTATEQPKAGIGSVALTLGLMSMVGLLFSLVLGLIIEDFSVLPPLRTIILPLSVAAVACGLYARSQSPAPLQKQKKAANLGLVLGGFTLLLILNIFILVALFFMP